MARIGIQETLARRDDDNLIVEFYAGQTALTQIFDEFYKAQTFVEHVIDERKYKWEDDKTIRVGSLLIKCDELKKVINHEPTKKQRDWELHPSALKYVQRIKALTGRVATEVKADLFVGKNQRIKSSSDGTTIAQIAADLNIEPGKARSILRKHKIEKPYAWKDPAPIIKLLKEN